MTKSEHFQEYSSLKEYMRRVSALESQNTQLRVKVGILKSQIREALEMSYVPEGTLLYAAMMKSVSK